MCTSSLRSLVIWMLWLGISIDVLGQTVPRSASLNCGTAELTDSQKQTLHRQATAALLRRRPNGVFTNITYVPIRPHIVRRSDGTGGFSQANLNQVMALANRYYLTNGLGIQFYFCGTTPDYVDNDALHTEFPSPEGSAVDGRNSADALNQYYANNIEGGRGGYAYYPSDSQNSTRSFIQTYGSNAPDYHLDYLGNYVIPHELGHTFGLYHTFGFSNGTGITNELVTRGAGANCGSAGDLICDTPADPYNVPGANFFYVGDCLQYDPNSTARDANGDAYTPNTSNIMSYYNSCSHDFTPGQYDHIQAGLALRQSYTTYTLNCLPTAVAAPTNVVATVSGSAVVLTWQDNAGNEMGYFVERSTNPGSGFLPVGGVGPNTATFTDTQFPARTTYYYRVRPSNATTGGLSATASATLPAISVMATLNIAGTSAQLNWSNLGNGVTYVAQWRRVGDTGWNTISGIGSPPYTLADLTVNTRYEWRVRTSDSPDYLGPLQFSTTCSAPGSLNRTVARTSALLYWDSNNNQYQSYTVRWRVVGAPDWTTATNLGSSSYALNNLNSVTAYEWQVQGVCAPSVVSDFSALQTFTTLSCMAPYRTEINSLGATSAVFYWYENQYEPLKTYEFRYRVVGAADWQVRSGLPSGYLSLTGLTTNTTYEWQLRGQCSATEISDYTDLKTFTTGCMVPTTPSVYATASTASISWYVNSPEPGHTYTLQYRPVGAANWTTINGLTSSYYSLTGLTNSVTYECRVQSVCSVNDQSGFSAVSTFTTTCTAPTASSTYVYLLTSTSVQLNWYTPAADATTSYDIQYRVVGAPDWITLSTTPQSTPYSSYTLTGLINDTNYEWQVRTVCSPAIQSAYVAGPAFRAQCISPPYGYANAQLTTATLSWERTGFDVLYDIQIRILGETNWVTLNNNSNTFLSMQGLRTGTTYEWMVRTRCSDGVVSNFSVVRTFQTASCNSPSNPQTNYYLTTASSARIQWSFLLANVNTRYEARYRVVGAADWITLTGLSSANGFGYYDLTGLTASTNYEWQIQTICSPTERSPFSASTTFQTLCLGMYTMKAGDWNDTTVWSCNRIPNSADAIQIKHTITVPTSYVAHALTVRYDAGQTLNFGTNAQLKLGL